MDHNPKESCFANKINIFHAADVVWLQVIVDDGMFVGRKIDSGMSGLAARGFPHAWRGARRVGDD